MELRAEVNTRKQLAKALDNRNLSIIYAPYSIVDKSLSAENSRIVLVPPVYLADCEQRIAKRFAELKNEGFYKVLVHTIGHIQLFSEMGFELYGGVRLNCMNSDSLSFYSDYGVKDIILSAELTAYQINQLENPVKTGIIAYGYLPLMITRRCPIKNGKPCNKECCGRTVKDRMNNELHVICSENTAEILNSDVLYIADKMKHFSGTDFAVLKFTVEAETDDIINNYLNNEKPPMDKFTRGLYFRGVKNQVKI